MILRSPFLLFFLLLESCLPSFEFDGVLCVPDVLLLEEFCTSLTWGRAVAGCVLSLDDGLPALPAAGELPLFGVAVVFPVSVTEVPVVAASLPDVEVVLVLPGAGWLGPGVPEPEAAGAGSMLNFCELCAA